MTRGEEGGLVIISTDITERKRAELALAEKASELERSNSELEKFAYVASHDLQEPLRMISGFTTLLADEVGASLSPEAREYVRFAVEGAERMRRLIADLLAYSRVGTRGDSFQTVELGLLIHRVLGDLQPAIYEAKAQIVVGPLPAVFVDEREVFQLFLNLLSNALKFRGAEPCRVEISGATSVSSVVIEVRDNGIGFEMEYADKIFEIFQRLNRRDEYPGTGIGLAICKKVVERHGGKISVESAPGHGARFRIELPLLTRSA